MGSPDDMGRLTAATNSTTAWWGTRTVSSRMPRLSSSVALRCLAGKRPSNRYTRMFVSTSAATVVEILARPAAIRGRRDGMRGLPFLLALRGSIEDPRPRRRVSAVPLGAGHDPDGVSRRLSGDLVAGRDAEPIGQ